MDSPTRSDTEPGDSTRLPDPAEVLELNDHLLYSSTLVKQAYYHMYGDSTPQNAPRNYRALAVLKRRFAGEGVHQLSEYGDDPTDDYDRTSYVPPVFSMTGDVTTSVSENTTDSAMFVTRFQTAEGTFTAFGSRENYHPLIQNHVVNHGEYHAADVWATAIEPGTPPFDHQRIHFCQIADEHPSPQS